jgi:thioredoxin-like negative regulator of GroEL
MKPIVHGLEAEYWGKIDFVYLDIDDPTNQAMMRRFGFTSQPLFVLIMADGTELERWFGYTNVDSFKQPFDAHLAASGG